ncbi:MAG: hypothetical protein CVU08_10200 [Bacteroidetes bacterium HGW-Bacteroidetes-3]|jgi:glycosyltransferase involved in cell wall biosynthesis|nr:MAG: hypothetical protein CVU08_10200 [Bacteroidetes bacterium HGW-Bacteroidetes-3]
MKDKRKILIICPALDNLGGTELETIITAKVFLENNIAKQIIIFSPNKVSNLIKGFSDVNEILFQHYPTFLKSKFLLLLDYYLKKVFKLIQRDYSPIHYFFWFFKSIFCKYDFVYVITDSAQFYYAPIIVNFNLNKVIIKFTTCFDYTNWNNLQRIILKKCSSVLVTAVSQKSFLQSKFQVNNIGVVDVFIWNEEILNKISVEKEEKFIFGMLCRISKEKKIEDAIKIVFNLRNLGYKVSLIIKGPSLDQYYLEFLNNLIIDLNVTKFVTIDTALILPSQIPDFYQSINAFLITSNFEGGPNTGMECLAAGIPVLSYDIGAMHERLEPFEELLIAEDFEIFLKKTIIILNLDEVGYQNLRNSLKKHYINNYSNELKLKKTIGFLS